MASTGLELSIVAPCQNIGGRIGDIYADLTKAARAATGWSYEIIFVDRGSMDGTWKKLQAMVENDPRVRAVKLPSHASTLDAFEAGVGAGTGARVLTLDFSRGDSAQTANEMLRLMDSGAAVVAGARQAKTRPTLTARAGAKLRALVDGRPSLALQGSQLMKRDIAEELAPLRGRARAEMEDIFKRTVNWVDFTYREDHEAKPAAAIAWVRSIAQGAAARVAQPVAGLVEAGILVGAIGTTLAAHSAINPAAYTWDANLAAYLMAPAGLALLASVLLEPFTGYFTQETASVAACVKAQAVSEETFTPLPAPAEESEESLDDLLIGSFASALPEAA